MCCSRIYRVLLAVMVGVEVHPLLVAAVVLLVFMISPR